MSDIYQKLIFENAEKGFQYKLTVSEFRGVEYIHLRKYFLSYEGEYLPSSEGASFPLTIENTFALLEGLIEICAQAESDEVVKQWIKSHST